MVSLALIVAGGIYLSSHIPQHVPLGPAVVLLAASAVLLAGNLGLLARVEGFAWAKFFEVAKWSLLAYTVIAGLIEYSFLRNHLSGGPLVVLTLSLVRLRRARPRPDRVHSCPLLGRRRAGRAGARGHLNEPAAAR